jgi:hypothetical protein
MHRPALQEVGADAQMRLRTIDDERMDRDPNGNSLAEIAIQ